MPWTDDTTLPMARDDRLVVEVMDSETLIYDLDRDQAHQLNPAAAAVFALCDGRSTVAQAASAATELLGEPVDAEAVARALDQLSDRDLLSGEPRNRRQVTRREVARRAGLLGLGAVATLPAIKSIVAPTPAHAGSPQCSELGEPCNSGGDCCSNLCSPTTNLCISPGVV